MENFSHRMGKYFCTSEIYCMDFSGNLLSLQIISLCNFSTWKLIFFKRTYRKQTFSFLNSHPNESSEKEKMFPIERKIYGYIRMCMGHAQCVRNWLKIIWEKSTGGEDIKSISMFEFKKSNNWYLGNRTDFDRSEKDV